MRGEEGGAHFGTGRDGSDGIGLGCERVLAMGELAFVVGWVLVEADLEDGDWMWCRLSGRFIGWQRMLHIEMALFFGCFDGGKICHTFFLVGASLEMDDCLLRYGPLMQCCIVLSMSR